MPIAASAEAARATRRRASSNGTPFWFTSYVGANRYTLADAAPPEPGTPYPVAFLVEQDPGSVTAPHFHQADQFQVIVGGAGTLGRHAVSPVTVHFIGRYSAYGPIQAGPDGLDYFTLRNAWDPGARYMEHARAELRAVPDRRHREAVAELAPADGPIERCSVEPLLPRAADGMAVWRYRLSAGATAGGPPAGDGAGQFWLVLGGSLRRGGAHLTARSCLFAAPDDAACELVAGPDGLDLLAMQFPRRPD
jgi:hypothetical protein